MQAIQHQAIQRQAIQRQAIQRQAIQRRAIQRRAQCHCLPNPGLPVVQRVAHGEQQELSDTSVSQALRDTSTALGRNKIPSTKQGVNTCQGEQGANNANKTTAAHAKCSTDLGAVDDERGMGLAQCYSADVGRHLSAVVYVPAPMAEQACGWVTRGRIDLVEAEGGKLPRVCTIS